MRLPVTDRLPMPLAGWLLALVGMRSRRLFTAVLVLGLWGASTGGWSAPPEVVYRIDERPPGEIFSQGFRPWGDNDYLLAHVTGTSLGARPSSYFIATTRAQLVATRIAEARFRYNVELRERPLYLYTIRADDTFFSADRYMEHLESDPPEGENRRNIVEARRAYRYQQEWVAAGGIAPENIISAQEVWFVRIGQLRNGELFSNADFVNRNTRGNSGIYPRLGTQPFHRIATRAFFLNSTMDFLHGVAVSLAYCPPSTSSSRRLGTARKSDADVEKGGCDNPNSIELNSDVSRIPQIPLLLLR